MPHDILISATWILSAIVLILTIGVVVVIISENRNPVRSLAWLTVLTVVPVFGLILYFVFGRDIKSKRASLSRNMKRKLKNKENAIKPDYSRLKLDIETQQLIRVGAMIGGAGLHLRNDAKIFDNGADKFDSLIKDIEGAKNYILFQYYIIENDSVGRRIADTLIRKANEGVKVFLIYDPVGCVGTGKKFFKRLSDAGITVKPFIPVRFPGFGTRINWRNHRKQCVIDGEIAYIGV